MLDRVERIWPLLALHASAGLTPARPAPCPDALDHGIRPYWNYLRRQNTMHVPKAAPTPPLCAGPAPAPTDRPAPSGGLAPAPPTPYAPATPTGRLIDLVI